MPHDCNEDPDPDPTKLAARFQSGCALELSLVSGLADMKPRTERISDDEEQQRQVQLQVQGSAFCQKGGVIDSMVSG